MIRTASPDVLRQQLLKKERALIEIRDILNQEVHTAGYSIFGTKARIMKVIEEALK